MEFEACNDKSRGLLDGIGILEANKDKPLVPITPDVEREHGDFHKDSHSPLLVVRELECSDSNCNLDDGNSALPGNGSPHTPKDGVFDPFAPGPDDLVRAPLCKKYLDQLRSNVARRLDFDSDTTAFGSKILGNDGESISDQEMLQSVYENLLEVVVSNQAVGLFAEISNMEWDEEDCKTPPLAPHLNGIAATCPAAPVKPESKSRKIDLELCRKLEF